MSDINIAAMKAALQKDNQPLKDVYDACATYCISSLIKYHNCPSEDANDLFIDALLVFREKVLNDRLEYLTNLRHFMLGICLNLNKKRMRGASDQSKLNVLFTTENLFESSYEEHIIHDETHKATTSKVMRAFHQLGESCQEILTLFYIHQHSMEEISSKMSLASSSVAKVTKMRCLKKWRETFTTMNKRYG